MAKLIEKQFTYECEICGARFTSIIQKVAESAANNHELNGRPVYKYKVGDFITAKKITDFMGTKKITRLVVDQEDHKPTYFIEFDRWDKREIFVREEDIEGLCPSHLRPVYRH